MIYKFFGLIFLVIVVVGYLSYSSIFPQDPDINVITPNTTGTVNLGLKSPANPLIIDQTYTIPLNFNSSTQRLTAASIKLNYDPAFITISEFTPSSSFPTILEPVKIENGILTASIGVKPESSAGLLEEGTLATFKIKTLKTGTTAITFEDPTMVTVVESSANALTSANTLNLTIKNPALAGDLNFDDIVNLLDFNLLISNYGKSYTILDFNSIIVNFGKVR